VFQSISARSFGTEGYGPLALLWSRPSSTCRCWGRSAPDARAATSPRGRPGAAGSLSSDSVRRWQIGLLVVIRGWSRVLASPLLLTCTFRRYVLNAASSWSWPSTPRSYSARHVHGHRQPATRRPESARLRAGRSSPPLVLAVGWGVLGPALAIGAQPRRRRAGRAPAPVPPPREGGAPVSSPSVLAAGLVCMPAPGADERRADPREPARGSRAQVGVLGAALILSRVPQYVPPPPSAPCFRTPAACSPPRPGSFRTVRGQGRRGDGGRGRPHGRGRVDPRRVGAEAVCRPGVRRGPGCAGGAGRPGRLLSFGRDHQPGAPRPRARPPRGAGVAPGLPVSASGWPCSGSG
jgi:hypothetical protein